MDIRTAAVATLLALVLTGCSSTVGGEPGAATTPAPPPTGTTGDPSPAPSSPTPSSPGTAPAPAGQDYTQYLLGQEQLPAGFEIESAADDPTAQADYVRALAVPEGLPITVDPPQCVGFNPYADLAQVVVVDALQTAPPVTLAQAAGPAGTGLAALRDRFAGCGTSTASATLPNGRTVTNRSTTTVLPDPDVGADGVLVLTVRDETGGPGGGGDLGTVQTLAFATVGPVVVGVRAIPLGGDPLDPAVVTQVLAAAVATVRG